MHEYESLITRNGSPNTTSYSFQNAARARRSNAPLTGKLST
jgi:hypothetical protein